MAYNTVSVTTSPTLIVAANNGRKGCLIVNNGAATVYIGPDANITTSNAIPLASAATFLNSGERDNWRGDIYGVAGSTLDIRWWEWLAG